MDSGTHLEITVSEHSSSCNPQTQAEAVSCKEEAICQKGPEMSASSLSHSLSKTFFLQKISEFLFRKPWTTCPVDQRGEGPSTLLSADSSKACISDGLGLH